MIGKADLKVRLYVIGAIGIVAIVEAGLQARLASAQTVAPPRTGHLFPPENLRPLESPDRAPWQKPDQIMDALGIAHRSKVADIRPRAGWFTIPLAPPVRPN